MAQSMHPPGDLLGRNIFEENSKELELGDVVIIGAGLSSLTAAAILSLSGYKVVILEQHDRPGGALHVFNDKGFEFDVGLHFVGQQEQHKKMLDHVTEGRLQWKSLGRYMDKVFLNGPNEEPVRSELNNSKEGGYFDNLIKKYPDETSAILRYKKMVHECNTDVMEPLMTWRFLSSLDSHLMHLASWLYKPYASWKYKQTAGTSVLDVMKSLTKNDDLISELCYFWGTYNLPPQDASFMIHGAVADHYLSGGAYFIQGGSMSITSALMNVITRKGGKIFTKAPVKQILVEDGVSKGVVMDNGDVVRADRVISSAGAHVTFHHLLSECELPQIQSISKQLHDIKPACGHYYAFLGFDGDSEELGLPAHNTYLYYESSYKRWGQGTQARVEQAKDDDPNTNFCDAIFYSFPSAKDGTYSERFPGKSTCVALIGGVPWTEMEAFDGTKQGRRGPEYEVVKERLKEAFLRGLYSLWPNLEGRVALCSIGTPLSTQHFLGASWGTSYGLESTTKRYTECDWLKPRTSIEGLWLTGQDIVSPGVVAALVAGYVTTGCMLSRNLLKDSDVAPVTSRTPKLQGRADGTPRPQRKEPAQEPE